MKLTVTPEQFEELIKKGYNLDTIFLLKLIDDQYDILPLIDGSMKIDSVYQSLRRKGLITNDEPATTDFEEWWKTYPGTDSFEYKGKIFKGTRAIRKGKDECRLKFDKIILEGDYKAAQLISALNYELMQKKESSVSTNSNRMTFMQNSVTYLNQRAFEAYIELINEGGTIEESPDKPEGGTDI